MESIVQKTKINEDCKMLDVPQRQGKGKTVHNIKLKWQQLFLYAE